MRYPETRLLLVMAFVGPLSFAAVPTASPDAEWRAGTASILITPAENMWMAGYSARKKPAEGKVQELFAKALALEDRKGTRVVIVTMDLIGVTQTVRREIEKRAAAAWQLAPQALLLNASHTHSGPEYRVGSSAIVGDQRKSQAAAYTAVLQDKLTEIIGQALRALAPARLAWSHARCGFAMNRRADYSLPPGDPNHGKAPNPDGPVDHDVPVLTVEGADGRLRAALFGYACHNTALLTFDYCGDYAGYAQEYLEAHRTDFSALFLMGCAGDQNPYPRRSGVVPGVDGLELTRQHGRALANAVETALTSKPRALTGELRLAYSETPLDYADGRPSASYPVQVMNIGDGLLLVALGGETVVDYALRLKRELSGSAAVWVAGYSNSAPGYVPSLRVLREGGYEANAGWAESVEERIIAQALALKASLDAKRD